MRHNSWDDALFVSYAVKDKDSLQKRLPSGLVLDLHRGTAYISVVALTEAGIVPWPSGVPLEWVKCFGLTHHAVNVRTYVKPAPGMAGPPGIFFFSLDCSALLPTLGAKALFNLPYRFGSMRRAPRALASRELRSDRLEANWRECDVDDTALGKFIVERYSLYQAPGVLLHRLFGVRSPVWCGIITHAPWPLRKAKLLEWRTTVLEAVGLADLVEAQAGEEPIVHCSVGVGPIDFFWSGGLQGA